MEALTLTACFDADPRPTCLVDLQAEDQPWDARVIYKNPALQRQNSKHLLDELADASQPSGTATWIHDRHNTGSLAPRDGLSPCFTYIIQERWRIIQWRETSSSKQTLLAERDNALADRDAVTRKVETLHEMMEAVSVGMFEYDWKGKLMWGNEAFYKLSGHPRESTQEEITWEQSVFPEDLTYLMAQWKQMVAGKSVTLEMRWRKIPHAELAAPTKASGNEQWVMATCVPLFDESGTVVSVAGCLIDTDRVVKQSESSEARAKTEALEKALVREYRLSTFADMTNIGIWMMDMDDKVYYCNREWFSVSGHPRTPIVDIDWSRCIDDKNLKFIAEKKEIILTTKKPIQYEIELLRPWTNEQGADMPVRAMVGAYPQLDEHGEMVGMAGTLTDVTHIRWAEIQKQRTDEALEAQRQQENFIDMTCHEIRNPLGAVMHCASLIRITITEILGEVEKFVPPVGDKTESIDALHSQIKNVLDDVSIIDNCCAHQKRIVDDILTVSKLDSKLLPIAPTAVQFERMMQQLNSMLKADAQKAGVDLRLVREPSLDKFIDGREVLLDFGRLTQVLINLVTNSIKFTKNEHVRVVTVTVGASHDRPTGDVLGGVKFVPLVTLHESQYDDLMSANGSQTPFFLHFVVVDTGCGFSSECKTGIFERFKQESVRTYSKYGGSGLGLFISREMAELQGGEIGAFSKPGEGATFAFYVKTCTTGEGSCAKVKESLDSLDGPSDTTGSQVINSTSSSPASERITPPQSYTILVVEDNQINQKVLRLQLQKLGHAVYVAGHGAEALKFLESTSAWRGNSTSKITLSVILMDTEMPIMGGIECARQIRKAQTEGLLTVYLPIISVSANARDAQVSCALECGMDDAIAKPFRVPELMPMIARLVEKHGVE